jgi:hypothetical protein
LTYLLPFEVLSPLLVLLLELPPAADPGAAPVFAGFSVLTGAEDVLEAALPPSLLAVAEAEEDEAGELLRA